MTRAYRFLSLALLLGLSASSARLASAQSPPTTGTPPFGSYGGGPEVINVANLNAHWDVPVLAKAGRGGFNFTYDLSYDSSVWAGGVSSGTSLWYPVGNWGWRGVTEALTGYLSYSSQRYFACKIWDPDNYTWIRYFYTLYTFDSYTDPFGIPHYFNVTLEADYTNGNCPDTDPNLPSSATGIIADSSGYAYSLHVPSWGPEYIYPSNGTAIQPPQGRTGPATSTDRNGNQITVNSSGQFFDTLSSTTPVLTVTGSSPLVFTYTAPSGANASYTMKYTAYTVKTNFGCPGISEYGPTSNNLVSEIDLPDGSKFTFAYEATPGYAGDVTGRLASVTLPTGGTISYSYSGGNNGIICADGSAATLTRTTPDGTWTYAHSESGTAWTTLVTDPQGNQTKLSFQGIYETQRQVYSGLQSGGNLLRQWTTCYNGNTTNCNTTAITLPITRRTVTDQYGSSGLQCKHDYFYNSVGGFTEQDDYDYGSGAPGALLRKTLVTYASLGNITAFRQTVTICNGTGSSPSCAGPSGGSTGTVVSQTNYNYDQTTPTATSGIAQHTSASSSRGNLTSINYPVSGLTSHFTYYDTGSLSTSQDVNGATTTYNYSLTNNAYCQMAFPTSVSEPLSLSRLMTWNCTGGVQTSITDENQKVVTSTYTDAYYWRPNTVTDQAGNQTSTWYSPNSTFAGYGAGAWLTFNNGNSQVYDIHYEDGLGRTYIRQRVQQPNSSTFDTVSYTFDANGRPYSVSMPCSSTPTVSCSGPKTTQTYDALSRPLVTTDGGGGTLTYSYSQNDVLVTVGPAPSGENTKRRQLEYDALGRLTSVCEITSAAGSGTCGQTVSQTGYWTKYAYDAAGNLLTVTQNAQAASGSQQTRSFSYDAMSRLISETNPESGTKTYAYDSVSTLCGTGAYTSYGDLLDTTDAAGNCVLFLHDSLHRLTDIGNNHQSASNPCKRFRYDSTNGVLGAKPSGVTASNTLGRLAEAETDTCAWPITQSSIITDEWLSYTARGETSDTYESTPHSGAYYHAAATYWADGVLSTLNGYIGSTNNYSASWGVDGEGRLSAYAGGNTTYNAASQPSQVNFAWGDSDSFTYDSNTGRMTQYKYTVGSSPQSVIGNLTWNANATLSQLAITDPFNPGNAQTCNYSHDDLLRVASANCGSAAAQTFSYDPFGNINKSGSPYSFQPTYSSATNRMTAIGNFTPTYDNDGNVTSDSLHTYAWDAYGNSTAVDSVGLTFDAFDRMVEQNRSGAYTQFVYSPTGFKMQIFANGQSTPAKNFVPFPGGATVVYTSSGLIYVRHPDWLGSSRFASTTSRSMYFDTAYAPFGEPYASTGTTDLNFTGIDADTTSSSSSTDYDFLYREYSIQGRWASPDRAGLAAVDPTDPLSWNRYAYVANNPLAYIDPLGLFTGCNTVQNRDANQPPDYKGDGPFATGDSTEADPQYPSAGCGRGGGGGSGIFVDGGFAGDDSGMGMGIPVGSDNQFGWFLLAISPTGTYKYVATINNEPVILTGSIYGNINILGFLGTGGTGGPGGTGGGTIGPQTDWFYTKQADCLGSAMKEFVGGLVLKKEIDAAVDLLLGASADSTVPQAVTPASVAVPVDIGLEHIAGSPNSRPVIAGLRAALREEGWKVSGNALAEGAKFLGHLALGVHVAFAAYDGTEAYNACMAN